MTLGEFNRFCSKLQATSHVVQWQGAHVWKVGAKVFAIGRETADGNDIHVTFKCSDMSYDLLQEVRGCRPAPYLASRGMKWIQRTSSEKLDDEGLRDYLRASHSLIVNALPKRTRAELGLAVTAEANPTKTSIKSKRSRTQVRKGAMQ